LFTPVLLTPASWYDTGSENSPPNHANRRYDAFAVLKTGSESFVAIAGM
jgi:hypothetical protein